MSTAAGQTRTLSTAEQRREDILRVALPAFAATGFHATGTAGIARDAGISQAYVFRLFPTKLDLFVAVCAVARERLLAAFAAAADRADREGLEPLKAIGEAYVELVQADPDILRIQLHGQAAAASEPQIGASVRRTFAELVELVRVRANASPEQLSEFFAAGMLINTMTAIGAREAAAAGESWAEALTCLEG